ncbi:MAG: hypothetical protein KBS52_06330 [Clostridiales bacterium]|nr:hypothetical protein [Candidatus Equinaster intestinalis]
MKIFEIVLIIFAVIYLGFLLCFLSKVEKPIKFFFLKLIVSLIIFAIINLTSFVSGVHIPVNYGTVIGTSVCGVPFLGGVFIINRIFSL